MTIHATPDLRAAPDVEPMPDQVPVRPRRWRRRLRWVAVAVIGLLALAVVGVALLYLRTDVPRPESLANPQVSVISYADGSEIARVGAENRIEVPLADVSVAAQRAVLAAEDRDYYNEPGISLKGIVRAGLANLRGGRVKQGASTITQQYAKNVYLSRERTFGRKVREAMIAVKLDRAYSKDEVLEFYLNTVYFGRGAYGIESAAHAFFGTTAAELTPAQGAVLAALLRSPSAYDPATHPERARARWQYVLRGMHDEGWLGEDVAAVAYPAVRPRRTGDALAGPQGYLVQQAQDELAAHGIDEASLRYGGLKVQTTIDRRAQAEAVRAVEEVTGKRAPAGLHRALVAVEPGTGRIRAEYAGADYVTRPFNDVTQGVAQAGSSFKPYVLAAALDGGLSLKTMMNGASPQRFGSYEVSNFGPGKGEQFGDIDLVTATAHSVNTVFVPLGIRTGLSHVGQVAADLGVTADMSRQDSLPSFSLGVTAVHPIDQAVAYATLAARGVQAKPFLVQQVTDPSGHVVYRAERHTRRVLPTGVTDDTTYALQQVVVAGTGRAAQLPGRPAAGKTGTTSRNTAAWFVGYTPQLATAVALFSDRPDLPLRNLRGVDEVTGGTLPARTWSRFMSGALMGQPVQAFRPPVYGGVAPSPSPSPSPTGSPSPLPTPTALGQLPAPETTYADPYGPSWGTTDGSGGGWTYDGSSPAPQQSAPSSPGPTSTAEPPAPSSTSTPAPERHPKRGGSPSPG